VQGVSVSIARVSISVRVLGSGDAFGSGGRLQTCFHVTAPERTFLVDCGSTALIAMRRHGVDPNGLDLVVLSHLHGDHFGGVPFLVLDAQLISRRAEPLTVAGPPGTERRVHELMEATFPGSAGARRRFELRFAELEPGERTDLGGVAVAPQEVVHPSGAPSLALRIECGGCVLAYTGDTEWTDALLPVARDADLLIAEGYTFDKRVPYHLDLATLEANRERLGARRIALTHLGADMVARSAGLDWEVLEDGRTIALPG
jgi:ribonuclease BN (tRNA processing enzyme)